MSLIDEALRRAQAAQTPGARSSSGLQVPMPLPDAGRSRGRLGLLVAAALAAAVLASGGVLLWRRGPRQPQAPRPAEPSGVQARVPADPTATPTLVPVEVKKPASGISRPPAATATAPMVSATRAPGSPTAEVSAAAPARSPSASPTPMGAAVRKEPTRTPTVHPPAEMSNASGSPRVMTENHPRVPTEDRPRTSTEDQPRRKEPTPKSPPTPRPKTFAGTAEIGTAKLELGGIVYSEGNPAALINGIVVRAGGFVDGYTVVRILIDRVELEGDAGRIVLTLK